MKNLLLFILMCFSASFCLAQNDTTKQTDSSMYRIEKTDGGELIGKILSQDAREVLLLTEDNRQIYIPQHLIKKIEVINQKDFNGLGEFVGEDRFATRYFITTNGLPIRKGEHYVQWNLFGPDIQFGVGENLGVGVMTSWVGIPIIGSIKKSWQINNKTQFAVGALVGTGSWAALSAGGALPFATISFGDRRKNIAFTGGYGVITRDGETVQRALTSVAGMIKVAPRLSLVFDSFIALPGPSRTVTDFRGISYVEDQPGGALLIPGLRWHRSNNAAFQFGFAGIIVGGEAFPVPIPMVQWYRTL